MPALPSVSLVVPTFNEAENIYSMIERSHAALSSLKIDFEIIVVDDSSGDGTADIAATAAAQWPGVRIIRRTEQRDLSQSVLRGWREATGDVLAVIDADLQHPPERLVDLLSAMFDGDADLAVASRNTTGGGVSEWALRRRVISWGATLIAMLIVPGVLRMVRDPMSGFFAIKRRFVSSGALNATGYKILLEVLARTPYETVVEVPYVFEERKKGKSKLGSKQAFQYLNHVYALARRTGEIWLLPKFAMVGLSGVFVNVAVSQTANLPHLALGFECSVLSNFLLNEVWTFRGRMSHLAPVQSAPSRLMWFQLAALVGLVLNLATFSVLKAAALPAPVCATIAIAVGGLCNFLAATHLTWSSWLEEDVVMEFATVKRHRRIPAALLPISAPPVPRES